MDQERTRQTARALAVSGFVSTVLAACGIAQHNADTFTAAGVLSGSRIDRTECPDDMSHVWVEVDNRGECLRYFSAGLDEANPVVHVWFHGDRMGQSEEGEAWISKSYEEHANRETLQGFADRALSDYGLPYIRFSRPGVYGSSGEHKTRRRPRESAIINAALDQLKERYQVGRFSLTGQSGGGHVVAALLPKRTDIDCAVMTSGVLSVRERARAHGWKTDITGYWDYWDPMDHIDLIVRDPKRRIFIVGDPLDRNTPLETQLSYLDAVSKADHSITFLRAKGKGRSHHSLNLVGFQVAKWCLDGLSATEMQSRLPYPASKG
ncbi:alpha/beta hydrolase [Nisaea nitritireducens]|uniref:alpha/beta hydrolase n=1 Tax=Nisaea nitritireducens TaxID=568392 RepID=UPI0018669C06|nr:alpha/beta hydrolase [Nisaea nitritireducens]